ncbi:MAG: hypothetical protein U0840_03180 [Gemmataceae bacterium]
MHPVTPFWFKQRQCRLETAAEPGMLRVTGPNLAEAFLQVELSPEQRWQARLRLAPAGPDVATAEAVSAPAAWHLAFELYRSCLVV